MRACVCACGARVRVFSHDLIVRLLALSECAFLLLVLSCVPLVSQRPKSKRECRRQSLPQVQSSSFDHGQRRLVFNDVGD